METSCDVGAGSSVQQCGMGVSENTVVVTVDVPASQHKLFLACFYFIFSLTGIDFSVISPFQFLLQLTELTLPLVTLPGSKMGGPEIDVAQRGQKVGGARPAQ